MDRAHHHVEVRVERSHQHGLIVGIGKAREAAQVGEPYGGPQALRRPPDDGPVQHAHTGIATQIGLHHGLGDVVGEARLGGEGERRQHSADLLKMSVLEAARRFRGAGEKNARFAVFRAGRDGWRLQRVSAFGRCRGGALVKRFRVERQDLCGVLRASLFGQLMQQRERWCGALVEPLAPTPQPAPAHEVHGAIAIGVTGQHGPGAWQGLNGLAGPPDERARAVFRMDGAHAQLHACQGQAEADETVAEGGQLRVEIKAAQAIIEHKGDNVRQRTAMAAMASVAWHGCPRVFRCPRRRLMVHSRPDIQSRSSVMTTGTWSDGFSHPRVCRSMRAALNRSSASGDKSAWSMRMPLFFCQAPA